MTLSLCIKRLRDKSNIDYHYYHEFSNRHLFINFNINNFSVNHIIYILNSDLKWLLSHYNHIKHDSITDIFIERIRYEDSQLKFLFMLEFKNLFWLKLNNFTLHNRYYENLINFLNINSKDINRIYLENLGLDNTFFSLLSSSVWFSNLMYVNLDNNFIGDTWFCNLIKFISQNHINLHYLSLIWNKITNLSMLNEYKHIFTHLKIIDFSANPINEVTSILHFIKATKSLKEVYIKNIVLENSFLDQLLIFFSKSNQLSTFRFSLYSKQQHYREKFLSLNTSTYFDISFVSSSKIYSTIYFKVLTEKLPQCIDTDYFYTIDQADFDESFMRIIDKNHWFIESWINLFLFDFHDYNKIDFLLSNYSFNYIYIENYWISDKNFVCFILSIKKNKLKKYKINLISIEINEFQLSYLIANFPDNIEMIEVNLNKIIINRELFISKMLRNKAFVFENIELYSKILK